jgi:hypothetical protein
MQLLFGHTVLLLLMTCTFLNRRTLLPYLLEPPMLSPVFGPRSHAISRIRVHPKPSWRRLLAPSCSSNLLQFSSGSGTFSIHIIVHHTEKRISPSTSLFKILLSNKLESFADYESVSHDGFCLAMRHARVALAPHPSSCHVSRSGAPASAR